jgi:hypothetical protein
MVLCAFGVDQLREFLETAFTVGHIAVGIETCQPADDAALVKQRMVQSNFDVLGLRENGRVTGYVLREELAEGACDRFRRPFAHDVIVGISTPLIEALPLLVDRPRLFVLDRTQMDSIVTPADLRKSPMRMLLFSLVSLLETYMLEMVRSLYPGESFLKPMSDKRQEHARKLLAERQKRNEEIDLADCLQMCDKRDLLIENAHVREFLGCESKRKALKLFERAEALRDRLAHAQDVIVGSSWKDVSEIAHSVESVLRLYETRRNEFADRFRAHAGPDASYATSPAT